MESKNFIQLFSNLGNPHDNAVAEAFFRNFSNLSELSSSLLSYIDGFYNTRRPHSWNEELTPDEKEALFWS